jgi:hypothetical protein
MKSKRLNILGYVQELLLRRYEALRDKSAHAAKSPSAGGRRPR